jgi:hypothetical protein
MSVSCECCVVRERSLGRADHTSRGALPSVVCILCDLHTSNMRRLWSAFGPQRHKEKAS